MRLSIDRDECGCMDVCVRHLYYVSPKKNNSAGGWGSCGLNRVRRGDGGTVEAKELRSRWRADPVGI